MERDKESEKDIENHLRRECIKHGWLCLKMRPYENGYPDRLVVMPHGLTAWVELKSTGCRPRKLQLRRMDNLIAMGHNVSWLDSKRLVDDLISILDEMCRERDTGE